MSKQVVPKSKNTSTFGVFLISCLSSTAIGLFVYILAEQVIDWSFLQTPIRNLVCAIVVAIFAFILLFMSGTLFKRHLREYSYITELKNFKDFVDSVHSVDSEVDIYKALFESINKLGVFDYVAVIYRDEDQFGEPDWRKISDGNIPLCKFSIANCPALKKQKMCYISDIGKEIPCSYQESAYKVGSYVCLVSDEKQTIILQLYNKRANSFDSETLNNIESYMRVIRPIVHNSRKMNDLNKKAITDKLTRIYNRSYLDAYIEDEITNSAISKNQLSIIMIDIDFFKKVNDNFGHSVGDFILTHFAEIIMRGIRKTDMAARYGGEEFTVVLPSTGIETATVIAERVRQLVADTPIPQYSGLSIPPITCSLGVACYPDHAKDREYLIQAADSALYDAKNSGRNCVKVYTNGLS